MPRLGVARHGRRLHGVGKGPRVPPLHVLGVLVTVYEVPLSAVPQRFAITLAGTPTAGVSMLAIALVSGRGCLGFRTALPAWS